MCVPSSKTTTAREIDIMQRLTNLDPSSDHLVDLYAVIETASNVHIVMELVEGGELFERVCDKGVYTEDEARRVMTGLIDALEVLHSQGIVHRDIKPENILLTKENDTKIKLTDFGLSNIMGAGDVLKSKCGTPVYMAPEMLQRKPYNTAVDVWSVGIILYIIVSGTLPFYADNPDDFLDLVLESEYSFPEVLRAFTCLLSEPHVLFIHILFIPLRPFDQEEWGDLSSSIQELIRQILVPNPRDRLTLDDIRASPWMTKSSQKR
jgi:serine/threonine protein kinase